MHSPRLRYELVTFEHLEAFHALIQDPYIRRYMLDGKTLPREWTEQHIRANAELFAKLRIGIWLAWENTSDTLIGFCGFQRIASATTEPELVYAVREHAAGHGYGTEMALACTSEAREQKALAEILVSVDEVNAASVRILKKLGFQHVETREGEFGKMFILKLSGLADS